MVRIGVSPMPKTGYRPDAQTDPGALCFGNDGKTVKKNPTPTEHSLYK
jgi:hypothetical protein